MLTIAKVSRKDAGLYECAAANTLGTAISSCTLAVARKEEGGTSGTEVLPHGERACAERAPWGLGNGQSRPLELRSSCLQVTGTLELGQAGFVWALQASLSPRVVLTLHCSSSALPLAGYPAHPVYPLTGLPGRPGTPEIPQKYKNTVLVLWKPAESKAPCTYTLERRLDGTWGCLPSPGSCSWKMGSHQDTKPGQKCPMSFLFHGDWWGPGSGVGGQGGCPCSALSSPCPCAHRGARVEDHQHRHH